jgi:VWFA-related protein
VDAIEIEMRVVERDGSSVTDLDQAEVEVLEDGRRQEITAFIRVSIPIVRPLAASASASSTAVPAWLSPPDVASNRVATSSRIFVLVLDDLHVDRRNTQHVKQAARLFVERYVEPGDLVSVVYTGVRPDAAQDFTSDRSLLLAAIDKFIGRKLPPATIERMEQYNMQFRGRGSPRFEDLRDRQDGERAFNARSAMASIESISALLGRVTGRRKAALFFSEGLDYDLSGLRSRGRVPGSGPGPTVLAPTAPTGGSEADAIGRLDVHSYASDVLLSLQAAMGAASRANVALYTMDVRGGDADDLADLGAPVDDPTLGLSGQHANQEMRDARETLAVLAENTGGFAALTPLNYETAFSRIVRESSEYYLLAYSPWNPAPDGKYREITVTVKRPGVRVSARRGYYAPRKPAKRAYRFVAPGISDDTSTLVMAPIPAAGLSLDVHTIALKRDKKKADVVVTAHIDGQELAGDSARPDVTNTLELALMAIDSAGKVQAATGRAIDVRLDNAASRILRESGYRVVSRLQVPPGRYQIRQAVRERNGGRQGSVFADLEVPDFSKRLTMSGVLLTSNRMSVVPTSVDPDTYERLAVLPSVRRIFSSDDELIAATEVYEMSQGREIALMTTIVDAAGRECYRRVTTVARSDFKAAHGVYRHAVQIPLNDAAGDLMLVIEARPIASPRESVTRRVPFTVTTQ